MSIHPTAIIHPDAQLHTSVKVEAYSIIGAQVTIGAGTVVGPHCVIDGRTEIGEGNRFFSGAQIGVLSQDLKHNPELVGRARIGDRNVIREHVSMSASTMESDVDDHRATTMADGCLLMACSHVAHDCHLGSEVIMANCVCLSGHVEIEDKAIVSGLAGVHQEVMIGTLSFVGGMARVSKDVPPYMLVEGDPPRCIGPNSVGLRRNGLSESERASIKKMYKIMYRADLNTTQALQEIERAVEDNDVRTHFVEFVRKSVRGIIK